MQLRYGNGKGGGKSVSEERLRRWVEAHGAWLAMRPEDVERARDFFQRHGAASVLVGRLVPVVRTLISVPAGFSRMPIGEFLGFTIVGTALWTGLLAWAGRVLGQQFPQVQQWVGLASWGIVGAGLAWYAYRVVKLKREGG